MECIYYPELISYIINFLDKDSIKKFCCVFKDQDFIKECLKYTRISRLIKCKWTVRNEMKSICETIYSSKLDRISDICLELCINKKRGSFSNINFENNKIIKLHIDLNDHNYGSYIQRIKSTSLVKITLVYCKIGVFFIKDLKENCPNLKYLTLVYVKTDNNIIISKNILF